MHTIGKAHVMYGPEGETMILTPHHVVLIHSVSACVVTLYRNPAAGWMNIGTSVPLNGDRDGLRSLLRDDDLMISQLEKLGVIIRKT